MQIDLGKFISIPGKSKVFLYEKACLHKKRYLEIFCWFKIVELPIGNKVLRLWLNGT